MTQPASRQPAPAGLHWVAAATLLSFGCATVRVPASTMSDTVPVRGGVAEPQLELWLESGGDISPWESAQASAQARAALQSALAGVSAPQGDAVLVVRAQGVARTSSRRRDQHAAVAGLVVGAVVVVAAAVAVLVASKGKGFGGSSGSAKVSSAPRLPRPTASAPRLPRVPAPVPVSHGGPVVQWPSPELDVNVVVGETPPPTPPPPYDEADASAWNQPDAGWGSQVPAAPAEGIAAISLPAPPPLDVADRGFFDGDTLRIELVVADRQNGAPLWTKVVDGKVDPRDPRAVRLLLERALADQGGWVPAGWEDGSVPAG